MTNSLVIADLHIDDYKQYNPEPEFRLHQPRELAKRLHRLKSQYGVKNLFILGDLINKPITVPKVIHELKNFLEECSKDFEIYYILGQHDCNSKSVELAYEDSLVNALDDIPNLHYMHNKFLKIEDCLLYMRNWTNVEVYPIPDEKIDIYLSHLSLGFGQSVDNSKFKLGIFGDIHEPVQFGNCYSVSTPYQHYPSQPEQGLIGLLTIDGNNCKYERLSSDDEFHRFLRLKETEQYKKANLFANQTEFSQETAIDRVDLSQNIYSQILDILKKNNLEHIHRQIPQDDLPQPINFNFKLMYVTIDNFKSIDHLELDFTKLGKVLFLNGLNGSGKSATIQAIVVGLLGDRQIRRYNREDLNGNTYDCCIDIQLSYNNRIYRIQRGPGYTQFWDNYSENEEPVSKNNKRDLENSIYEELPFLNYLNFFIVPANSHFFNNFDRVQLFKVCFNLFIFDYLMSKAWELSSSKVSKLSEIETKKNTYLELIETYKIRIKESQDELNLIEIPKHTKEYIQTEINRITTDKHNLELLYSKITSLQQELIRLQGLTEIDDSKVGLANEFLKYIEDFELVNSEITKLQNYSLELGRKLQSSNSSIKYVIDSKNKMLNDAITCPRCGNKIMMNEDSIKSADNHIEELNREIKELESQITSNNELIKSKESERSIINSRRPLGFESKESALTYISKVNASKAALSDIDEVNAELEANNSRYKLKSAEFVGSLNGQKSDEVISELNRESELLYKRDTIQRSMESMKSLIVEHESKVSELENEIKSINSEISDINKYSELFNVSNLNSISYNIIETVTKSLNNELVRFKTTRELASGEARFAVSVSINVQGAWRDYDSASDGQKCILDLYIINRVVSLLGNVGLLIMDESLANIDKEKYELANDFLRSTPVDTMLVTSHDVNFTGEDNRLSYELVNGITQVLIS